MFIAEPFHFTPPSATPRCARAEIIAFVVLAVIALASLAVLVASTGAVHMGYVAHTHSPHLAR